jgi:N-acetylglucosaminyldiphosphoundecaprenol N-acetyl-beta-D-mannosaminyltransferase
MKLQLKNITFPASKTALGELPEGKLLINTINAHSYNVAQEDAEFAEALLRSGVLIPDGAGVVWAKKWLGRKKDNGQQITGDRKYRITETKNQERIAGWDLFEWEMGRLQTIDDRRRTTENVETAYLPSDVETRHATSVRAENATSVFFLGSSEAVLAKIKEKAAVDYPNLELHTYSPPYKPEFTAEDNRAMIEAVNAVVPDLLWIGMTAPKQEKWAYKHYEQLNVRGHIGTIGAVFDFYAGTVERAPLWWQDHSLEWLYRLISEPKRMWRRYLVGNVKFLGCAKRQSRAVWAIVGEKIRKV